MIGAVELKFFRRMARYTLFNYKGNEEILEEVTAE
jgi:hypothetical protein